MHNDRPVRQLQKLTDVFGRHIVGLAFTDEPADNPQTGKTAGREYWLLTGFIVGVEQRLFLVVAGHVVRDLKLRHEHRKRRFNSFYLVDGWHLEEGRLTHIPFVFSFGDVIELLDENLGLDCALVPLSVVFAKPLIANGVIPLDERFWDGIPDVAEFRLVGLPTQTKTVTATPTSKSQVGYRVTARMPILSAQRVQELPEDVRFGSAMIAAKLDLPPVFEEETGKAVKFDDIDGMSGGPLFGIARKDGEFRYWLCGVQSSWYKSHRIIGASPMPVVCEGIRKVIRERMSPPRA